MFIEHIDEAKLEAFHPWLRIKAFCQKLGIKIELSLYPISLYYENTIQAYGGDAPIYDDRDPGPVTAVTSVSHELAHWLASSPEQRKLENFGFELLADVNKLEEAKARVVQQAILAKLKLPLRSWWATIDHMNEAQTWFLGTPEGKAVLFMLGDL